MALKFRLRGLAETFIDKIRCPKCGHDGGKEGDEGFKTDLTKVTYDGIIVVIECDKCHEIFVPDGQRLGIINSQKLRSAVEKDSVKTGQPVMESIKQVRLDVEKMKAHGQNRVH